jgi:hypothetical protein
MAATLGLAPDEMLLRMREVVSLLDNHHYAEAAVEAQALHRERRGNWRIRSFLAQALGGLGSLPELLTLMAAAPQLDDVREASIRAAAVRGATARGFSFAHDVARAVSHPHPPSFELLQELFTVAENDAHMAALEEDASQLPEGPERAMLAARCACRRQAVREAVNHLAAVPSSHPLWAETARQVFTMANRGHDLNSVAEIGTRLAGHHRGLSVGALRSTALAAASCADQAGAQAAFALMWEKAAALRQDPDSFARHWAALASSAFDLFDVEQGRADVARAESLGLSEARDDTVKAACDAFIEEFADDLEWSRRVTRAFAEGAAIDFPEDELVRIAFRLPMIGTVARAHTWETQISWLRLVSEILRQARQANGRACMVLDGLAGEFARRKPPPFTASYHSQGRLDGAVHFKEADLPNFMTLDTDGYAGWSSLADKTLADLDLTSIPIEVADTFLGSFVDSVVRANTSKYAQPTVDPTAPLPYPYVFVAMQIPTDRVQKLARLNAVEMLEVVTRRFAGTGINVVAKRHPRDTDQRTEEALVRFADSGLLTQRQDSIHTLIAGSEAVITANSGVGSEALAHLKPVYLFGKADYAAACHNVFDEADFISKTSPIRLPVSVEEIKQFLFHYRRRYMVDTSDREGLARAVQTRIIAPALALRS